MLKFTKIIVALLLFAVNIAFAQPKSISLEYDITRNGKHFGTVKEVFTQDGKQYHVRSVTKGTGIYALLGERVLMSKGEVTANGLKPMQFELLRGDSERKSLRADFDWTKNILNMLVKGKTRTATLVPGTQDLASYAYQFMYTPPMGDMVRVPLTTGKKLKQYDYKVAADNVVVKAGGAQYKTIHLVNASADSKKKKELWLAKTKYCIPVRYLVIDKHGDKLEQTLTKINVE
jgi:hypothetical protein